MLLRNPQIVRNGESILAIFLKNAENLILVYRIPLYWLIKYFLIYNI